MATSSIAGNCILGAGSGAFSSSALLGSRMLKTVSNGRNPLTKWLRGDVQIDSYLLTFSLFSVGGSRNAWRHDVNRNAVYIIYIYIYTFVYVCVCC